MSQFSYSHLMRKIFCPEFNRFERISATEAWSLFLSASNHQYLLGEHPAIGRYLTATVFGMLMAILIEAIVG
ncbi:MAG: hypothetical protein ACK456_02845 [Pseudanabaenaceae cyanobacterium]|jgi:hypothetical protein